MDKRNKNILIILGAALVLSFFLLPGPSEKIPLLGNLTLKLHMLELSIYDSHMNAREPYPASDRIVLITIDGPSTDRLGPFPWPRGVHGKLLNVLTNEKAAAAAFDVNFGGKTDAGEDEALARAAEKNGRTISVTYLRLDSSGGYSLVKPYPELEKKLALTGYPDVNRDMDHVLRKVQLEKKEYRGLEPFFLTVYRVMENKTGGSFRVSADGGSVETAGLRIPLDGSGSMLISFSGRPFRQISCADVLEGRFKTGFFKDKACFIISTSDPNDQFKVPRKTINPGGSSSSSMFGGQIHASALQTVLEKRFIRKIPDAAVLAAGLLLCVIAFIIVSKMNHLAALPFIFGEIAVYFLFCRLLFVKQGIWITFVNPVFALCLFWGAVFAAESQRVKTIFCQLVPGAAAGKMLISSKDTDLGGKTCNGAALFSDIRGYTALSEIMEPARVLDLLNRYHSVLKDVIIRNKGNTFDYAGDGTLVAFGAPDEIETPAIHAVKAALEIQQAIKTLNESPEMSDFPQIRVGIGICTGSMVCGFMGQDEHKKYSIIGDVVNTAARLQGISDAMGYSIIIEENTYLQVKDSVDFSGLGPISLKGKKEPVNIYGTLKN